jgi:hypothetical protein
MRNRASGEIAEGAIIVCKNDFNRFLGFRLFIFTRKFTIGQKKHFVLRLVNSIEDASGSAYQ